MLFTGFMGSQGWVDPCRRSIAGAKPLVFYRRRHCGYVGKAAVFRSVGKTVYNYLMDLYQIVMNGFLHASLAALSIYPRCYCWDKELPRAKRMSPCFSESFFLTVLLAIPPPGFIPEFFSPASRRSAHEAERQPSSTLWVCG